MGLSTYEQQAERLMSKSATTSMRLEVATSVRDGIEIVHTSEYVNFLKSCFPAFKEILTKHTSPTMEDNEMNALRHVVYEILNRLPFNEVLRPYESELLDLALESLREENEKNALLCLRVIFDLHRNFRPTMDKRVEPFIRFVHDVYEGSGVTIDELLGSSGSTRKRGKSEEKLPAPCELPSHKSFKVMMECPLIVMLVYQLYNRDKFIQQEVEKMIPLMVKFTGLQTIDIDSMSAGQREFSSDLKSAQVKTIGFITFLLRGNSVFVEPHHEEISNAIVSLLRTCPDVVATRKELLIATRHVLSSPPLCKGFFQHLDLMMDEDVLVGTGRMCIENLRPLAYSFLAELVHHMKAELTLEQIRRAIHIFSRNMQDETLPLSTHMTCVRLMHHLVESVFRMRTDASRATEAREFLVRIMYATVAKFRTLRPNIPELLKTASGLEAAVKAKASKRSKDAKADGVAETGATETPNKSASEKKESSDDPEPDLPSHEKLRSLSDNKAIIKTLTIGMKTLLWSITNFNGSESVDIGLNRSEIKRASGFIRNGVKCMQLFNGTECTEMCTHFSEALLVLEPRNFVDMMSLHFDDFFAGMLELPTMVQVPHLLLQNTKLCRYFADAAMTYLLEKKLECLRDQSSQEAQLVLKLFSLLLHAISKHSHCESVLSTHVIFMMDACLKAIRENDNPSAYVRLLRYLFRAMAQAKFDVLYQEVVPILPATLDCLLAMLNGPDPLELHDTVVELCLILPARLSSILPHLPKLAMPLCRALRAHANELNLLGLRTLEFWVDSLNPEFLDPCIAEVESELMLALWAMLKPQQSGSPFGAKAMQLLGKLGGRNRAFLKNPLKLDAKSNPEHGLRMILMFKPDTSFLVPLDRCIVLMQNILTTPMIPNVKPSEALVRHRRQALTFIRTCLVSILNLSAARALYGTVEEIESALEAAISNGWGKKCEAMTGVEATPQLGNKTKGQLVAEQNIFKRLVVTVIAAECDLSLKETDEKFMDNVCEHVALLFVNSATCTPGEDTDNMDHDSVERPRATNLKVLETTLFLDALMTSFESTKQIYLTATVKALATFLDAVLILSRDELQSLQTADDSLEKQRTPKSKSKKKTDIHDDESPYPILASLVEAVLPRFVHCCYKREPHSIIGGVEGFNLLIERLPTSIWRRRLPDILSANIRAIQLLPAHAPAQKKRVEQVFLQLVEKFIPAEVSPRGDDAPTGVDAGVSVLVDELCNLSSTCASRAAIERALLGISERTSTPMDTVLSITDEKLMTVFERPLLTRHVLSQIQTVKLINFCLNASPHLITFRDKWENNLRAFINEALTIAEVEDPTIMSVETRENEAMSTLRQSCVQLISSALKAPEFSDADTAEELTVIRERISTVLFTSLTSRNKVIVEIAKKGLVEVKPYMNKNTLKQSVSPILMNLQHLSKLSVPLLEALEYLLELLAEWFSPTLGEKLLEHIKYWIELDFSAPAVPGQLRKSPKDAKLIAAIVNLFHLLPKLRDKNELKPNEKRLLPFDFIKPLVRDIMVIESTMPPASVYSSAHSLFIVPLTKFLNRYPKESVAYFLARLDQPEHFARFVSILKLPEAADLLKTITSSSSKLLHIIFGAGKGEMDEIDKIAVEGVEPIEDTKLAYYNGLQLLATIAKLKPDWLPKEKAILKQLNECWDSNDRAATLSDESKVSLPAMMETKYLAKCFLSIVKNDHSQVEILFKIISVLCTRSSVDFTFVREFVKNEVVERYTPAERNAVLKQFLKEFAEQLEAIEDANPDHVTCSLKVMVNPMLEKSLTDGRDDDGEPSDKLLEIVTDDFVSELVTDVFEPSDGGNDALYTESVLIQLLQLSTLLIRYVPKTLVDHRKELIKFGWNHLKREDSSSKQWAFVNISYFLQQYQAPEKIILQVFVALLRAYQPEQKALVTEALDALAPALPVRLPPGEHKYPIWIRYTKKSLIEGGHSLPQIVHIWSLIVRHAKLFYSSRAQFVPQMVNLLSRLGLPTSSSHVNRALSVDLVELIINWENDRVSGAGLRTASEQMKPGKRKAKQSPEKEEEASPPPPRGKKASKKAKKEECEAKSAGRSTRASRSSKAPKDDDDDDTADEMMSDLPETETLNSMPSIGVIDEGFKPSPAMEEIIVNFLVRMTFITCEGKEQDSKELNTRTVELLSTALEMWPSARIKFTFVDKLLTLANQSNRDPTSTLLMSLSVLRRAMKISDYKFFSENVEQTLSLIEPCLSSTSERAHSLLAEVVGMAFDRFKSKDNTEPESCEIQLRHQLDRVYTRAIADATVSKSLPNAEHASTTLACTLKVMATEGALRTAMIDENLPKLMKVLARLTHELNQASAAGDIQPIHPKRGQTPPEVVQPEYGSVANCMVMCIDIISKRVINAGSEQKQIFLRLLLQLINDKSTHGNVLMAILDAMIAWADDSTLGEAVSDDERNSRVGSLNAKETVLFLSKLAQLTRMGLAITQTQEWEEKLLNVTYKLCSAEGKHEPALRSEVFLKVERLHLLGLRTRRPELRKKFFSLYHEVIGKSLFQRLQYILCIQDWDAMADTFWLMQGLDLILSTLAEDERIMLAPNSALISPLLPIDLETKNPLPVPSKPKNAKSNSPELDELIKRHAKFLHEKSNISVNDLMTPLRQVATRNAHIAYYLWVLIFPIVWATLQREEQLQLAKPMIGLLSKESHLRQAAVRPNVIQALLEGISLSQPQLKIPSELTKFLGKTFNAWHTAIALLENHVVRYPQEARCFDALSELYRLLNEQDVLAGLWMQRCHSDVTRAGLSLSQHGHWQNAQEVFFEGIQLATAGQAPGVSKTEMCLWETQWLNSAMQLNQWDLISDFSRTVEHSELMVQSMWRLSDWAGVKELLPSGALNETEETPEITTVRAFASLVSGRVREAEQHWANAVKSSLDRWWRLPETGSTCHIPSLHVFNAIAEVQESTRILLELSNTQRRGAQGLANNRTLVQDIMETWRLRTPNEWDQMPWWNEILMWRGNMHNIMTHAAKQIGEQNPAMLQVTQQLDQLGQRERAWSLNKFANAARKQNLPEVALNILNRHQGQIEVSEAFSKLREQCESYLSLGDEAVTGLNLLESQSLEFFAPPQKAELFRLRAKFQEQMEDYSGAYTSYATAVTLCKQLAEGWISWGHFLRKHRNEGTGLMQATTCLLQGVRNNVQENRHELLHVVRMLAFDANTSAVGGAIMRHLEYLPKWVWIPWIPQLLLSLGHNETQYARSILLQIVAAYPQALYYQLRTSLLERRDAAARATQTARKLAAKDDEKGKSEAKASYADIQAAAQRAQEATIAFEAAKEVMEQLRVRNTNLVGELEVLLSELGTQFACTPEERLLVVVCTLLHRCYKYPAATTGEVPENFKKELIGVYQACFSADTSVKHADFVKEYKASYERDLNPEQKTFPKTVAELMSKLKGWKQRLMNDVEDSLPASLRLEDESMALRHVTFNEIEVPGQYANISYGVTDRFMKLNRIGADVHIVRRNGNCFRRLEFLGTDGSIKQFIVQTSLTPAARGEERMLQFLTNLNDVFAKHAETRRRNMCYYTPAIIPVWPQVRLLEDDDNHGTYQEVYDANFARYGREADLPITLFKAALDPAILGEVTGAEDVLELRLKALMEITQKHVTENIFSQYMYKTLPNSSHLWTFKRQLSQQLAMSSLLSALLRIGGRTPQKIAFAKDTGNIFMLDFHPTFDSNGIVEYIEPVPFRLTRNLHTFFTPFGVKGDFVASMASAAHACSAPESQLEAHLELFFRDQLILWPWRRMGAAPNVAPIDPSPTDINTMALSNVQEVLRRLSIIAPIPPPGASAADTVRSVQKAVMHLVDAALNIRNVARMESTWAPWF
ncbi:Tetratricopeptide-like helical [Ostreococcus tauri]|uniref:Tetratricopeptide-like helical n=1 Tax=Ostreococcus tauri TaxID=70448 RepID=A0A090M8C3_OSTTA|nr:Tetratricopeptide-like helical [Ostreococcus tauri]CEG01408.1 Tetratricopeptide-like helical [Ostreococcus tauri]|eukprot:XP_022840940.1 Tetratricopeptide-like helical [Ostreococcus tauri]